MITQAWSKTHSSKQVQAAQAEKVGDLNQSDKGDDIQQNEVCLSKARRRQFEQRFLYHCISSRSGLQLATCNRASSRWYYLHFDAHNSTPRVGGEAGIIPFRRRTKPRSLIQIESGKAAFSTNQQRSWSREPRLNCLCIHRQSQRLSWMTTSIDYDCQREPSH